VVYWGHGQGCLPTRPPRTWDHHRGHPGFRARSRDPSRTRSRRRHRDRSRRRSRAPAPLPDDLAALKELVLRHQQRIAELELDNLLLNHRLAVALKQCYGPRADKVPLGQMLRVRCMNPTYRRRAAA